MIWSVSILVIGRTTVRERMVEIGVMALGELSWIGDAAADGAGGGGCRARQQGARAGTLTAFEIAVAGAHAVLAGGNGVAVHADTHGAAGFPPFGAGFLEDAMQSLGFGGLFDGLRSGDD